MSKVPLLITRRGLYSRERGELAMVKSKRYEEQSISLKETIDVVNR